METLAAEELLMVLDILHRDEAHPGCDLVHLQVLPRRDLLDVLLEHEVIQDSSRPLVMRSLQANQLAADRVIRFLDEADDLG